MQEKPNFMSIRAVAKTGLLSEYTLRRMIRENRIPCIFSGRKCLINYSLLVEQLNSLGRRSDHES